MKKYLLIFLLFLFPILVKSTTNTFYPTKVSTTNPTGACIDGTLALNTVTTTQWFCSGSIWHSNISNLGNGTDTIDASTYATIQLAINACVTTPCVVIIPPTDTSADPTSVPSNVSIVDWRNPFAYKINGIFTNTQMNKNLDVSLNSCDTSTEWTRMQSGFSTDAISGCISTPVGATVHNASALAGYANTSSTLQGIGGTLGIYTQCTSLTNGSKCWGGNDVSMDIAGLTTGVTLIGREVDVQPQNASSAYTSVVGEMIALFTPQAGTHTGSIGLLINHGQTGSWDTGIEIDNGNASVALIAGAICGTGTCISAPITLKSLSSSSARVGNIYMDTSGNMNLQVPNSTHTTNYIFNTSATGNYSYTFASAITGNHTLTLPDVSGTVVTKDVSNNVNIAGSMTAASYSTATNCSAKGSAANPSLVACGSASSGAFSVDVAASGGDAVVSTTAVTANSNIFLTPIHGTDISTRLGVTCNSTSGQIDYTFHIAAIVPGVSFDVDVSTIAVNPLCLQFLIIN